MLRGRVGIPAAAYLSDDQMEVYTTYPVEPAVILYDADAAQPHLPTPLPRATVTLLGGTITTNGLTFKSDHGSLQRLEPGTECLLLLKHVANRYFIAGQYEGAFAIGAGGLYLFTSEPGPCLQRTRMHQPKEQSRESLLVCGRESSRGGSKQPLSTAPALRCSSAARSVSRFGRVAWLAQLGIEPAISC